jgi:hypothetical protein
MPPVVSEYCDYINQGYLGYTYNKADFGPSEFPCPPSATLGTNTNTNSTGQWFCTITTGARGVTLPKGAISDCSKMASGTFGYSWK